MEQDTNQPSEKEPTVLDLYKSVTKDWRSFFNFIRSIWDALRREELNQALAYEAAQPVAVEQAEEPMRSDMFPFRAVLAFLLALLAQALVETPESEDGVGRGPARSGQRGSCRPRSRCRPEPLHEGGSR